MVIPDYVKESIYERILTLIKNPLTALHGAMGKKSEGEVKLDDKASLSLLRSDSFLAAAIKNGVLEGLCHDSEVENDAYLAAQFEIGEADCYETFWLFYPKTKVSAAGKVIESLGYSLERYDAPLKNYSPTGLWSYSAVSFKYFSFSEGLSTENDMKENAEEWEENPPAYSILIAHKWASCDV